ncbi:hypothetical protein BJ878DRAFT_584682 [Calycina marina]|uniref:Uncharacterized protein n=1 Tax=Calycina marina TaxID=1763456 RepID=A0A9P7YXJ2_9HELO|nr:hypothetical protein BJ878DRAFT_584682 [Calycina marina]
MSSSNYSLYTVSPGHLGHLSASHVYASGKSKSFDSRSPREYIKSLENEQTIDKGIKDRIACAEAAQTNGFESLAFFASAVTATLLAGVRTAVFLTGIGHVFALYIKAGNALETVSANLL